MPVGENSGKAGNLFTQGRGASQLLAAPKGLWPPAQDWTLECAGLTALSLPHAQGAMEPRHAIEPPARSEIQSGVQPPHSKAARRTAGGSGTAASIAALARGCHPSPSIDKIATNFPRQSAEGGNSRASGLSPRPSGGVMRQKVRHPTHSVSRPRQKVSHPIQNVDRPTRSVRLPMHNYRHPMHYVRLPIHFIAIRWGFCAFVGTKWPTIGKSVQKRDTWPTARSDSLAQRQQRGERDGERGNLLG